MVFARVFYFNLGNLRMLPKFLCLYVEERQANSRVHKQGPSRDSRGHGFRHASTRILRKQSADTAQGEVPENGFN